ncbi:MAG: hypothetical protein ACM3JI_04920 [Anaerolineae bacterium]
MSLDSIKSQINDHYSKPLVGNVTRRDIADAPGDVAWGGVKRLTTHITKPSLSFMASILSGIANIYKGAMNDIATLWKGAALDGKAIDAIDDDGDESYDFYSEKPSALVEADDGEEIREVKEERADAPQPNLQQVSSKVKAVCYAAGLFMATPFILAAGLVGEVAGGLGVLASGTLSAGSLAVGGLPWAALHLLSLGELGVKIIGKQSFEACAKLGHAAGEGIKSQIAKHKLQNAEEKLVAAMNSYQGRREIKLEKRIMKQKIQKEINKLDRQATALAHKEKWAIDEAKKLKKYAQRITKENPGYSLIEKEYKKAYAEAHRLNEERRELRSKQNEKMQELHSNVIEVQNGVVLNAAREYGKELAKQGFKGVDFAQEEDFHELVDLCANAALNFANHPKLQEQMVAQINDDHMRRMFECGIVQGIVSEFTAQIYAENQLEDSFEAVAENLKEAIKPLMPSLSEQRKEGFIEESFAHAQDEELYKIQAQAEETFKMTEKSEEINRSRLLIEEEEEEKRNSSDSEEPLVRAEKPVLLQEEFDLFGGKDPVPSSPVSLPEIKPNDFEENDGFTEIDLDDEEKNSDPFSSNNNAFTNSTGDSGNVWYPGELGNEEPKDIFEGGIFFENSVKE